MDGSSNTYITPERPEPICVASRTRCASHPASVTEERSSVKYSSPTSIKNCKRLPTSFKIGPAIFEASFLFEKSSVTFFTKINESSADILEKSEIFFSPTKTASTSGFKRLPLQDGQGSKVMYRSISTRVHSESVSFQRLFKLEITPS